MSLKGKRVEDEFEDTTDIPAANDLLRYTRIGYRKVGDKIVPIDQKASLWFSQYVKQLAEDMQRANQSEPSKPEDE